MDIQLSEEDRVFIEERVRTASYKTMTDVVRAGLRSLRCDEENVRRLIQEGEDDIAAGRVYEYDSADALLADVRTVEFDH